VVVRPEGPNRRLAAILCADVVGYSRLMAEDEAATVRTLTAYRKEIQGLVADHRGRVVDATGDNLLAEFPTALDAVECAVEIQRVLGARNAGLPEDHRMEFRIGVHLGDVTVEEERLYGDGVNIAARLEGLADPGGICISATIHEQVESKLDLRYEDLGEKLVHNIPRPVHVYRLRIDTAKPTTQPEPRAAPQALLAASALVILAIGAWWVWDRYTERAPTPEAGSEATLTDEAFTVPGFGDAPAIAVLPFDNLTGDPEQEYFADGIAEDLITRLSRRRAFPVIARNSSLVYRGRAVGVKQVSRELGARYVVEGSVRRAGDRVRISAQLIDATIGHHLWAETYDQELRDIFAVQDQISQAIVGSLNPALLHAEVARVGRSEPRNLDAYELAMRGTWHLFKGQETATARSLFERAIELDPQSSRAFTGLAWTHWFDLGLQQTETPARSASELMRAARRAVEADSNNAMAHHVLSLAYATARKPIEMIAASERAIELDPSLAIALSWLANSLSFLGRLDEALASGERTIRLSPRDPMNWLYFHDLATVHFNARRYEDAVEWERRSIQGWPRLAAGRALLAASYAHLGRMDEARKEVEEVLRLQAEYSLAHVRETRVAGPAYLEHYLDGLRKAGLPEE
jgi:adenylate cyclase